MKKTQRFGRIFLLRSMDSVHREIIPLDACNPHRQNSLAKEKSSTGDHHFRRSIEEILSWSMIDDDNLSQIELDHLIKETSR